jgi:hypothetical protein
LTGRLKARISRLLEPLPLQHALDKAEAQKPTPSPDAAAEGSVPLSRMLVVDPKDVALADAASQLVRECVPEPYATALGYLKWPSKAGVALKERLWESHTATEKALAPDREWWRVYDPHTGKHMDMRLLNHLSAALDGVDLAAASAAPNGAGAVTTDADLEGAAIPPLRPNGAGWRSLVHRAFVPPPLQRPVVAASSIRERTLRELTRIPGVTEEEEQAATAPAQDAGTVGTKTNPASSFAPSYYFPRVSTDPFSVGLGSGVSDQEASDWWIALACSPLPRYTHALVGEEERERAAAENAAASVDVSSAAATKGAAVSAYDYSLSSAMRRLGVIDPWSRAAASVSRDEAKSAAALSAADAAVAEGGISGDALNDTHADAAARMDLELATASAAPFDIYQSLADADPLRKALNRASAAELTRPAYTAGVPMPAGSIRVSPSYSVAAAAEALMVQHTLGRKVTTPALATPGESISNRIDAAYWVLRRTYKDVDKFLRGPNSMSALQKSVAARKIQKCWRTACVVRAARAELYALRDAAKAVALGRLAAVQDAMMQFCRVLEASAGLGLENALPDDAAQMKFMQAQAQGQHPQSLNTAALAHIGIATIGNTLSASSISAQSPYLSASDSIHLHVQRMTPAGGPAVSPAWYENNGNSAMTYGVNGYAGAGRGGSMRGDYGNAANAIANATMPLQSSRSANTPATPSGIPFAAYSQIYGQQTPLPPTLANSNALAHAGIREYLGEAMSTFSNKVANAAGNIMQAPRLPPQHFGNTRLTPSSGMPSPVGYSVPLPYAGAASLAPPGSRPPIPSGPGTAASMNPITHASNVQSSNRMRSSSSGSLGGSQFNLDAVSSSSFYH